MRRGFCAQVGVWVAESCRISIIHRIVMIAMIDVIVVGTVVIDIHTLDIIWVLPKIGVRLL